MIKKEIGDIVFLGAGNMGTALSQVAAVNGFNIKIWNWEGETEPLEQISKFKMNKKYLDGVQLSSKIKAVFSLEEALQNANLVFFCLPTNCLISIFERALPYLRDGATLVDVSKGMDEKSLEMIPLLISKKAKKQKVVSISGPAVARQMANQKHTVMAICGKDKNSVSLVRKVLENDFLRFWESDDMAGVEVGGFAKNIYAIVMGLCDGLKFGENTKAIFFTLAMQEMADLSVAFGGKRHTVYGIAGLGDFIATSFAKEGRNRRFGENLGLGMSSEKALEAVGQVVEGAKAIKVLLSLAKRKKINLPLAKLIDKCIMKPGNQEKLLEDFLKKL